MKTERNIIILFLVLGAAILGYQWVDSYSFSSTAEDEQKRLDRALKARRLTHCDPNCYCV